MIEESLPSIWASIVSWFTPTVLFVLINIVIGTIVFSTSKHKNKEPRPLSRTSSLTSVFENLKSLNLYRQNSPEIYPPLTTAHQQPIETDDYAPTENQNKVTRQISRTSSIFESLRSFNLLRQNSQEITPPLTEAQQQPIETVDHAPTETQNKIIRQISRSSSIFESLRSFNLYRQKSQEEIPPVTTDQQLPIETVESIDHGNFTRTQSDSHPTVGKRQEMVGQQLKKAASAKWGFEDREVEDEAQRPSTVRERRTVRQQEEDEEVDARADDFIFKFKQQLKLQRSDSILRYKEMLNRGK